jgi:aspartate/methionine/tyrosine aminotransferase
MPLSVPLAARVARLAPADEVGRDGADAEVPARAREASLAALRRGETHYTDRPGILPLRAKVAERIAARFGAPVDAAKGVVITCGVTEARFVAVQQLVAPGSVVVALSHPERLAGACVVRGATLASPDDGVAAPALLYLSSDTPADLRDASLSRAKEGGWPIVFETGDGDWHPASVGLGEQTITIGSIGIDEGLEAWRIGFLAAPAATAGPLRDFKQALTICTTNLSQWGALALLEEPA